MTWLLAFRDMGLQRGGPVTPGVLHRVEAGSGAEGRRVRRAPEDIHVLRAQSRDRRLAFITHGYNVPRDSGVAALCEAADRLQGRADFADILLIPVLWPGDADIGGPAGGLLRAAAYPFVGGNADKSAQELARWVDAHIPAPARLDFISHSLGARIALGAPGQTGRPRYSYTGAATPPETGQICMMAAAVRSDAMEEKRFRPGADRAGRVCVLHSRQDKVLHYAFPLGDPFQSLFNWSGYSPRRALGRAGPYFTARTPAGLRAKVHADAVADGWRVDHGDYLPEGGAWNPGRENAIAWTGDAVAGKTPAYPAWP